jgi:hypothetical protein
MGDHQRQRLHRFGTVERGGVRVRYDVHGTGDVTLLLPPAWAIVDSRLWGAQNAFVRRCRSLAT